MSRFIRASHEWKSRVILGVVCALVIGIYYWSAEAGFFESVSHDPKDSYYNLLVQGFRAGQLSVNRDAPPELTQLANPYDPAANASAVWDTRHLCYEMSYYQGKLYLYYGITPALVLFWPYAAMTGGYCTHKSAVMFFFALGFLAGAWLIYAIWRRYFAEVSVWVVAVATLAFGLATGVLEPLSNCDLHEVPHSCGFTFTLLTVAAIWNALHSQKRQVLWLALASVAYGLAIGARPSLLFGIIILLMPVVYIWCSATGPNLIKRIGFLVVAAVGPAMVIGFGLAAYNVQRFDNPFEFGWRYQMTDIQNSMAHPFSLNYLWFNLKFYFLEPARFSSSFPFLQAGSPSPLPPNYYSVGGPVCGMLWNYPVVWLALAAPFACRGRAVTEALTLRVFLWAAFLLFIICAFTLCCFFSGSSGYLSDFLPALMLLAVVGILGLERTHIASPARRRLVRLGWGLLLFYSILFSLFAGIKIHAVAHYIRGNSLSHQGRGDEAVQYYQKAVALEPDSIPFHIGLGNALSKNGSLDEGMIHYQKVLEINPENVEALYDLSLSLAQLGRLDEAGFHLQKALRLDPGFVSAQDAGVNNNIAWSLATGSDAARRNGTIAVILAEAACQKTQYQQTVMVGTLAAAYAEAGRFNDAITAAQKACELATKQGETNLLQRNQELLEFYLNHQPYHESPTNMGK